MYAHLVQPLHYARNHTPSTICSSTNSKVIRRNQIITEQIKKGVADTSTIPVKFHPHLWTKLLEKNGALQEYVSYLEEGEEKENVLKEISHIESAYHNHITTFKRLVILDIFKGVNSILTDAAEEFKNILPHQQDKENI